MEVDVKVFSRKELANVDYPVTLVEEAFSFEELSFLINGIFQMNLFVIKIEYHSTDFYHSWKILFGNQRAKNLLLKAEDISLEKGSGSKADPETPIEDELKVKPELERLVD